MQELLRFTSTGTDGITLLFPPKYEFVFYETKMDLLRKGKFVRSVNYDDITEIAIVKNWQNNVLINCKPYGINIYKVSDEICAKIKEITKK